MEQKLRSFTLLPELKEQVIVHLIENKYIDEERFAKSFARGKHNYKGWGKNRIIQELKFREISKFWGLCVSLPIEILFTPVFA